MMVNSAALISAPFLFFLLLQVYTGDYEFGLRQGTGKLTLLDGRIYEGAWLADKKHGQGVCKVRGGLGFPAGAFGLALCSFTLHCLRALKPCFTVWLISPVSSFLLDFPCE